MNPKAKKPSRPAQAGCTPAHIKTIMVPVDFSEPSLAALRCAAAFAEHFGAKLILLHVVEPMATPDMEYLPMSISPERFIKLATRKLQVLGKSQGSKPSPVVQTLVRTGKPFREITDAARELKADLIIIATHGYTGLERALLGSTAERVVRYAPCPVLTLREREWPSIAVEGANLLVLWPPASLLQSADEVTGPWHLEYPAAAPYLVTATNARTFYRACFCP